MWALWIFFILLLFLWIQSYVYKKWGFKKIEYNRFFSLPAVFEDQELEMVESISNYKILPMPWIRVESKINKNLKFGREENRVIFHDEFHRSVFSLFPYMKIVRRYSIKATKRGCYDTFSVALTCGNFFTVGKVNQQDYPVYARLLVYPKIIDIDKVPLPSHNWRGDLITKRWIFDDPFMISGVREYQYGDPLNRVNWTASARSNNLQVHQLDYTTETNLMILLNVDIFKDAEEEIFDKSRIENGIVYAASILYYFISEGIKVGFGTNGKMVDDENKEIFIPPESSYEHMYYILEVMAKLRLLRRITFSTYIEQIVMDQPNKMDLLVITTYKDEIIHNQIEELKAKGHAVEVVMLGEDEWINENNL
jgi:uncharacterized protein (DUF58 family)